MKLGEFIKNFSHNNLIRLHYKIKGGQETVAKDWDDVSMDWEVNRQEGCFRHFINNEVIGLVGIYFADNSVKSTDALNIVIERLENQTFLDDKSSIENLSNCDNDDKQTVISKLPDRIVGGDIPAYGINKFINPKLDDKFSPNLYRFLTYKKRHLTNVFQDPKTGIYYIGLRDEKGIWIGAILMNVFCLGGRAKTFSYATSVTSQWKEVTTWFWSKYLEVGKEIYNLPEWKVIH